MFDFNNEELSWEEYEKCREKIIKQTQDVLYNEFGKEIPRSIINVIVDINYIPYINLITFTIIILCNNIMQSRKLHTLQEFHNLDKDIQKKLENILPLPEQIQDDFKDRAKIFTDKISDNNEVATNFFYFLGEYISMLNNLRDLLAHSMGLYDDVFDDLEEE